MNGADLDPSGVGGLEAALQALLHLGAGIAGECEQEDRAGLDVAVAHQPCRARGEHGCLARAGGGDDQGAAGVADHCEALLMGERVGFDGIEQRPGGVQVASGVAVPGLVGQRGRVLEEGGQPAEKVKRGSAGELGRPGRRVVARQRDDLGVDLDEIRVVGYRRVGVVQVGDGLLDVGEALGVLGGPSHPEGGAQGPDLGFEGDDPGPGSGRQPEGAVGMEDGECRADRAVPQADVVDAGERDAVVGRSASLEGVCRKHQAMDAAWQQADESTWQE